MGPKLKVVTRLPLEEVWREDGLPASTQKMRLLHAQDIANLLRVGPVNFVVADIGMPLRWIDSTDCYKFWNTEIKAHLADPDQRCALDDFPGGYFYFASEWRGKEIFPIVVVERHH
jgi:hypothetical protein